MAEREVELEAWRQTSRDVLRVLHSLDGERGVAYAALRVRLAKIRLRVAVYEEADAVLSACFPEGPPSSDEADPMALLGDALEQILAGQGGAYPVLGALSSRARAEATRELNEALDARPGSRDALRASAAMASAAGDWKGAAAWLERLAIGPGDPHVAAEAYQAVAEVHWRQLQEPEKALACFQRARALRPDDVPLLDKILKLQLELEQWSEAVGLCRRLISMMRPERPADVQAAVTYLLTLGEIHLRGLERPGSALAYYLDAIARMPTYAISYTLLEELLKAHAWSELEPLTGELFADRAEGEGAGRVLLKALRSAVARFRDQPSATIKAFQESVGRSHRRVHQSLVPAPAPPDQPS